MSIQKIKISDTGENFSFTGNANDFINSLNRVMEVTGYVTKNDIGRFHIGVAHKGKFYLIGYSDETHCILEVPGFEAKKNGAVLLLEPDKLKSLFKKRGDIEFTYDGKLNYKAVKGRFSGNVSCGSIGADQLPRIKRIIKTSAVKSDALCPRLLKAIRDGVRRTNISDPHMDKSLLSYIIYSKSKLIVSNADPLHLAHYEEKVKTKAVENIKLALPANMFSIIDRFLDEEDAAFSMSSSSFSVASDTFCVGFPPVQTQEENFNLTKNYITSLGSKTLACSFTLDTAFKDAQESLKSLTDNGERYTLTAKKKKVTLSVGSDFGKASDAFDVDDLVIKDKGDISVRIDPKILNDLLPLIGNDPFPFELHKRNGAIKMYTMRAPLSEKSDDNFLILIGSIS